LIEREEEPSCSSRHGSLKPQIGLLSEKMSEQCGTVEIQSDIHLKIIDANGKIPLSRMAGILPDLEMSILDWKGREVASMLSNFQIFSHPNGLDSKRNWALVS
jgi:hypothetical protein